MKLQLLIILLLPCITTFGQLDSLESIKDSLSNLHDQQIIEEEESISYWSSNVSIGFNIGHNLEVNSLFGNDKKGFSTTNSLDLDLSYYNDSSVFSMTNELHYMIGLQKEGLQSSSYIQRTLDDLNTLHDFSIASRKKRKWSINIIAKVLTSTLKVYNGDYLKDHNNLGQTQGFFNPYEIIFSPGIKFQPTNSWRFSFAPYSVQLYGLTSQDIADTGYYTEINDIGQYELFEVKPLGVEFNIWYDKKIKKWLKMQYRLGVSADYLGDISSNGIIAGLFITKVKLIEDLYLSHRGTMRSDFSQNIFQPNYKQAVLLTYSKSF